MAVIVILLAALVCSGCAVGKTKRPVRVALLAPFEGRYREIGYDALYAARLALSEAGPPDIELLAVDDGGSSRAAAERARALAHDPRVVAVVVLGYDAAQEDVQRAFSDMPVIIVGEWLVEPQGENIRIFSSPVIPGRLSYARRLDVTDAARVEAPFVGGEVFALRGFRAMREDFTGITVVTSGILPDAEFVQRIAEIDEFAFTPGVLSTEVYSVFRIVINTTNKESKQKPQQPPNQTTQTNPQRNPTPHTYALDTNGQLVPTYNTIE